jgi:hypothetical protein
MSTEPKFAAPLEPERYEWLKAPLRFRSPPHSTESANHFKYSGLPSSIAIAIHSGNS